MPIIYSACHVRTLPIIIVEVHYFVDFAAQDFWSMCLTK